MWTVQSLASCPTAFTSGKQSRLEEEHQGGVYFPPTENPMYQWRSFQALTAIKDTLFRVNTTKFLSERSTEEG